jgi:hypothetical protein
MYKTFVWQIMHPICKRQSFHNVCIKTTMVVVVTQKYFNLYNLLQDNLTGIVYKCRPVKLLATNLPYILSTLVWSWVLAMSLAYNFLLWTSAQNDCFKKIVIYFIFFNRSPWKTKSSIFTQILPSGHHTSDQFFVFWKWIRPTVCHLHGAMHYTHNAF